MKQQTIIAVALLLACCAISVQSTNSQGPTISPCDPPNQASQMGWELFTAHMNPAIPFPQTAQDTRPFGNLSHKLPYAYTPITAQSKNMIATGPAILTKGISLVYANNASCYQPPAGQAIFGALNLDFNGMVEAIKNTGRYVTKTSKDTSKFVPIFRKLQYMILNDLYIYLTALYATFVLTITPNEPDQTKFTILRSYETLNSTADLNKKSLIVSHLLNLIQAQMFYICNSTNPMLPKSLSIRAGSIVNENDHSIDPMIMLIDYNRPFFAGDDANSELHKTFKNIQQKYIQTLRIVLEFFKNYTNYFKTDPQTFLNIAQTIKEKFNNDAFTQQANRIKSAYANASNSQQFSEKQIALRKAKQKGQQINPPFFYFDHEMLRSLKVLPKLASELNPKSNIIPWPQQIVTQIGLPATNGLTGETLPFALAEQSDDRLFINLVSTKGVPYKQEVLKQPAWLNSQQGVINMARACLGDFGQLIGLGILESELELIINKATGTRPTAQVQEGAHTKLKIIYDAQAQYEKDQCSNQDSCCAAAAEKTEYAVACNDLKKRCTKNVPSNQKKLP